MYGNMVDYPHIIEKRLRKTRIVDFHRVKLAVSYSHIFKGCEGGFSHFSLGNATTKAHGYFQGNVYVRGGEGGGATTCIRREGYSLR